MRSGKGEKASNLEDESSGIQMHLNRLGPRNRWSLESRSSGFEKSCQSNVEFTENGSHHAIYSSLEFWGKKNDQLKSSSRYQNE